MWMQYEYLAWCGNACSLSMGIKVIHLPALNSRGSMSGSVCPRPPTLTPPPCPAGTLPSTSYCLGVLLERSKSAERATAPNRMRRYVSDCSIQCAQHMVSRRMQWMWREDSLNTLMQPPSSKWERRVLSRHHLSCTWWEKWYPTAPRRAPDTNVQ